MAAPATENPAAEVSKAEVHATALREYDSARRALAAAHANLVRVEFPLSEAEELRGTLAAALASESAARQALESVQARNKTLEEYTVAHEQRMRRANAAIKAGKELAAFRLEALQQVERENTVLRQGKDGGPAMSSRKFTVEFVGFESESEAAEFVSWYSTQGEQAADFWFEERLPGFSPYTRGDSKVETHEKTTIVINLQARQGDG